MIFYFIESKYFDTLPVISFFIIFEEILAHLFESDLFAKKTTFSLLTAFGSTIFKWLI